MRALFAQPLRNFGAIDRVDSSPAEASRPNRLLVIDYKSGSTFGYDGLDTDPVVKGRHLQLALYARAVRANIGAPSDEVRAEYRFVSSKGNFERRQIIADQHADDRLVEAVTHAVNGIRAGAFLPVPGERERGTFANCRFCEYDRICSASRDDDWSRKHANATFVPLRTVE